MTFTRPTACFPKDVSSTILLDCDDTLFDYLPGFRRRFRALTGLDVIADKPDAYDLGGWLPVEFQDKIEDLIRDFNNDPDYFGQLDPLPGAVEFVEMARRQGFTLKVLTSSSLSPVSRYARWENLNSCFGPGAISDVVFVDLGASKLDELKRHARSMWVDDLPRHVHDGIRAGHHGILVAAAHNRKSRHAPENRFLPLVESLAELTAVMPHTGFHSDTAPT